ncbi:uncharacterized protein apol isoform X6 [Epinephelus fuscoguttatus]|uniref:uncharacterized protein apol isoform X6 n=1 Tax=Epinephelus fuscoguttatus TaxID=293821 RepID=UPI0020D0DD55|nr:uncharacterized protein apol isoform X6 [Epinephelus fuscoguttatus]
MKRENLERAWCQYVSDTLSHIDTVRGFRERLPEWMDARKRELTRLKKDINQLNLTAVLKDILRGLKKLDCFLDAVEKLAVTSLHVFMKENQVLHLPEGISPEHVQVVIIAARLICPLLLVFKRDASVFFLPKLQNVEVLSYQLDRYIQTTKTICEKLEKSVLSDFRLKRNTETVVDLNAHLCEDDIERMLCHINQLDRIRMDQHFRTNYLFQNVSCCHYINEFTKRQPRMLQFLKDLEENAVQLDRMNKGAKISSVVGSSVGAVGGVLSIIGLALIPVTAGVSLGLIIGGTALGITSGVNSAVTTTTELVVNHKHQKEAGKVFQRFMEDVQSLQDCLEEVSAQPAANIPLNVQYLKVLSLLSKPVSVGRSIHSLVTDVSALQALRSEEQAMRAGLVAVQEGQALRNVPRVASDLPDIGQATVKGSLALSKSARAGFIALNALFLGMDIVFICKDSISLAKGSETEVSQFIRARAALWSSEMDSWQKIHDSLSKGLQTSEKNKAILETPFYPEREMKTERASFIQSFPSWGAWSLSELTLSKC